MKLSFRQDMIDLISSGKKTVTIRPVKPLPYPPGKPWSCKEGDIVTVKENESIKLRVISVEVTSLQLLGDPVWRKDGLDDVGWWTVARHWDSFYGDTSYCFMVNPLVRVIEFEKL